MSSQLQDFANRLAWMRIAEIIDAAELGARKSRARASLVVNPLTRQHYAAPSDRLSGNQAGRSAIMATRVEL